MLGILWALGVNCRYKCLSTLVRGNEIIHEKPHNPSLDQDSDIGNPGPVRRLLLCIPFGGLEAGTSQVFRV